ncbi:hypothetical protein [Bifidobacterium vansinderenii]|uniref:Uncharacterized protein n=1 Tax=Bifidobacterium vansinderenii TaxID=1984871 RepID=A0A229VY11_9BIFI|nr:hypothetical protein [Bifidobacterium vansinderenii]OXN00280.1 hypothetical protein Tam10B_1503 [Bifidobacterium vansinderenii]
MIRLLALVVLVFVVLLAVTSAGLLCAMCADVPASGRMALMLLVPSFVLLAGWVIA